MTAAYNRARMPQVRAFVDTMRELFGSDQVKVTWALENGIELGKRPKNTSGDLNGRGAAPFNSHDAGQPPVKPERR